MGPGTGSDAVDFRDIAGAGCYPRGGAWGIHLQTAFRRASPVESGRMGSHCGEDVFPEKITLPLVS